MFDDRNDFRTSKTKQERPAVKLHYTVTPIGGKAELAKWKEEQVANEKKWQLAQSPVRAQRRENAIAVVAGKKTQMPLTKEEKAEIQMSISTKRTRKPRRSPPKSIAETFKAYQPLKPKTFLQKLKTFISDALFPNNY